VEARAAVLVGQLDAGEQRQLATGLDALNRALAGLEPVAQAARDAS